MNGFYRAQMEYERRMECPYDKGGALYEEEEYEEGQYEPENDEAYWSHVDKQMEDAKLGD